MAHGKIYAKELGIDLASKKESQLFRWWLACLLFGKPIQQEIAATAYTSIIESGVPSLEKLLQTDWHVLVVLLDQAHYVRYDFSTASKLLEDAQLLKDRYGSVTELLEQSKNIHELEKNLMDFNGIGPVTASIFIRDVAPIWYKR